MRQNRYVTGLLLVLSSMAANAQDAVVDQEQGQDDVQEVQIDDAIAAEIAEEAEITRGAKAQRFVTLKVDQTAKWFDSFFDDPNYIAEDPSTRVRFRPELYIRKKQDAKLRFKVAAKVNLPSLSRKLSVVVGGDEGTGDFENSLDQSQDSPSIGLQYFGKQSKAWNVSMTVGLKFDGFAAFAGPRVRYLKPVGESSQFRFVQSVRWFTDDGWDTRSRLDFDHVFDNGLFFRQVIDGRRRAEKYDEEGFRTRVSTSVIQQLGNDAGLQYEWFTIFNTKPDNHVYSTTLALRYRKRYKYDWLFFEVVPQLAFEDEFDWDINPGIRLRLEIIFGEDRRKNKSGNNNEFRW